MNLRRVRYLIPLQCRGLFGGCWWGMVGLFMIGLIVFSTSVGWDGKYPTLFGEPEVNVGASDDWRIGIPLQLASYQSFAWVIALFVYAVPAVLVPIVNSFSLTQTVWLRGLWCSPRDVAAARAVRLLMAVGLTAALGLVWVAAMVAWHQIPARLLLTVVLGWTAHLLLSGGVVLSIGRLLGNGTQRVTVAVLALLLPVILWLPTLLWANHLSEWVMESWLPYACPLTENLSHSTRHYGAAAGVGLFLTVWSVLQAGGRIVHPVGSFLHN